jgi:hypothetical protein
MMTTFTSVIALGVAVAMAVPADRAAAEPMVLSTEQLDWVTAGKRAQDAQPALGSGHFIASVEVNKDTTGAPPVESLVLSFKSIDPGPGPVLPFVEFTLERNETDRLPRYTPQWTDFNTHDPGQR